VKVVIFQWPCGADPRKRLPRSALPRDLIMLVAQPVSSTKMSLSGSRLAWLSRQRCRPAATSGRSVSLASTVFFVTEPHLKQQARDCALAGFDAERQKPSAKLYQGDVGLFFDSRLQPIGMRRQRRTAPACMRLGGNAALAAENLHPFNSRRRTNLKHIGLRPCRPALLRRPDQTHPKIVRISH
jgi:hypothetical protein